MNMMVLKPYMKDTGVGKMNQEKINKIKIKIEEFEYIHNGLHRLNGTDVKARNLRIRGNKCVADIYLIYEDREEKHFDIEYDIDKLCKEDKQDD